jgi:5-methylcytosine-specific restriction endonuclease McrA
LAAIGATIEQAGDRLLLRPGAKPVPAAIIRRVREAKAELLVLLQQTLELRFERVIDAKGEPGLEQPYAARRERVQELDRTFLHFCLHCGRFAAFGYGVHLSSGRWYCGEHRPGGRRF